MVGVLSLVKRHGVPRVEAVCAEALELSVPTYRFVARTLARIAAPPLALKQIDRLRSR